MARTPLEKVTVLDCSTLLPGPYCTMMLGELGARVLKVERVGSGDPMRTVLPGCFDYLNGNKRLLTLDLKHKEGQDLFLRLAEKADVVVEGFRPCVAARLGIDFDKVKRVNNSIIYCSISGYGQTGPYAHLPGHDINYQGLTGLFSISGDPKSGPEFPYGFQVADLSGSMFALTSILGALIGRSDPPSPIFLDVSCTESLAMWMMPRFLEYVAQGRPPKAEFMGRAAYGIFQTRDGKYLTLGVVEDHFWKNLCGVLGFDDLSADPSLLGWTSRNRQRRRILPRLNKAIKEKDLDFWLAEFAKANIPAAPVTNLDNWMDNPHLKFRGFVPEGKSDKEADNGLKRYPVEALIKKRKKIHDKPMLGRDTALILSELGLSSKELLKLKKGKVI